MVNGDGATLIDFGLALVDYRLHSPIADRLTPPGTALGTPPYAAPEQLRNPYATTVYEIHMQPQLLQIVMLLVWLLKTVCVELTGRNTVPNNGIGSALYWR